ncbi:MAG: hypothetical protein M1821_000504 [Bathelium mastoideum]|nr:MAG: hypothetical protein M1821_000504 [Bathelium mastoideum]
MEWLAKSGGHGYSTTLQTIQDAVLVSMENFNYANVQGNGTVVVGSGMLFGDLVKILGDAGREVNVGSCPCVGVTGAMLGGGLGRLQGKHGLTSDALRKAEVALWNGTIVEASENINSELFWALRGSGQNYGIVYETTYETWTAENNGMHYNADMTFRKGDIASITQIINSLTGPGLNRNLAFMTFFLQNATTSELEIILNLVYAGPESEGQKYTKLFSNFSLSLAESVLPWSELPAKSALGLIQATCAEGPRYDLRSLISQTLAPQTWVDFTNAFETFLIDNPLANGSVMMIETFAQQGIEALPDDYTAFPHRKFFQNQVELIGVYEDDSVAEPLDNFFLEWKAKFIEVDGSDQLQVYQNYGHGDEPLSALYGYDQWRHERLTNVKNEYDPKGKFDGYHAIPKDLAKWT